MFQIAPRKINPRENAIQVMKPVEINPTVLSHLERIGFQKIKQKNEFYIMSETGQSKFCCFFFLAAPMPLGFISAYWYSILLKSLTINVHLYQICICVRLHVIHECVWSLMDVMRCSQMCFFLMDRLQNTLIFYKFFSETRESCLEYLLH